MKITFVYPEVGLGYEDTGKFYHGAASLVAYLRQFGHVCRFIRINRLEHQRGEYISFLKRERPDIVAFSATTNMFPFVPSLASLTKNNTDALTICGGIHATLNPVEVISAEGIDLACIGEGELALAELCDALQDSASITSIANVWVKQNGRIYRNLPRPLVEDLDTFPFVDREILDYHETFDLRVWRRGVFMASRGCPYNCSYCCNHALKQVYPNRKKYVRFRSVEHVIEEIEKVISDFPSIELITFHDDILPLRKQWFEKFISAYRRKIKLPFEFNCHPNLMTKEIGRMAKSAGCVRIHIGIESGSDWIRNRVLNRRFTKDQIVKAFSTCDELGIQTSSYNMIGLPFETRREILDTIKLNAQVKPHNIQVSIFYPYPRTKLHEVCKNRQLLSGKWLKSYFKDTVLRLEDLTPTQLKTFLLLFRPLVWAFSKCRGAVSMRRLTSKQLEASALAATSRPFVYILFPLFQGIYATLRFLYHAGKRLKKQG